jgi:hypothetical protein
MRKLQTLLITLVSIAAGICAAQETSFYTEPGPYYPLQMGLYPTLQIIHFEESVVGMRINVIGDNRGMTGLDVGIINQTDQKFRGVQVGAVNLCKGNSQGVHVGLINHTNGDMKGFQGIPLVSWWNALNVVHGHCTGAQGGFFNEAQSLGGIQGGLVNVAYEAEGLMAGVYNYTETLDGMHIGLINIADEAMTGFQLGLYNGVASANGLQIGLINQCQNLYGVQVGLVNIASQKDTFSTTVLVNWNF